MVAGGLDDRQFVFGRYKGQFTPRELLTVDPNYLVWAAENLEFTPFTRELEEAARAIRRGEKPKAVTVTADAEPFGVGDVDSDIPF